ncbi:MAG: carboxypeptidase-like regulatory domain-containing protein [Alphaproteobacteria bacterium]|nr:carboxypeptidase-like regulatory domain-containing protein [Alphaproteobacteria bacterium]
MKWFLVLILIVMGFAGHADNIPTTIKDPFTDQDLICTYERHRYSKSFYECEYPEVRQCLEPEPGEWRWGDCKEEICDLDEASRNRISIIEYTNRWVQYRFHNVCWIDIDDTGFFKKFLEFVSGSTSSSSSGQGMPITGTVKDSRDNFPLFGVTVRELGTDNFVKTETDGTYNISVQDRANFILEFSLKGYKTTREPSDRSNNDSGGTININIELPKEFPTARVISDAVAGVVMGTLGGIITNRLIKKNQIKKGFEDLSCVSAGKKIADWGDEFQMSGAMTRAECDAASGGRDSNFIWASKTNSGTDYAGLREDTAWPENNACWIRVEIESADRRIRMDSLSARYFMVGTPVTCGGWLDDQAVEKLILDAKRKGRTWGTVAGATGGAAVGVAVMETVGHNALGIEK